MSRPDLDIPTYEQWIEGSKRLHCAQLAEARELHRRASFQLPAWLGFVGICAVVAAAFVVVTWFVAGPPPFFNFLNR